MRMNKGQPFMDVEQEVSPDPGRFDEIESGWPVFSEGVLYPLLGKGDARFVLGVANEYDHIIKALGPQAVKDILDVKPRLCQRLGLPDVVKECLEDAHDEYDGSRRYPEEVAIPKNIAYDVAEAIGRAIRYDRKDVSEDMIRLYELVAEAYQLDSVEKLQEEVEDLAKRAKESRRNQLKREPLKKGTRVRGHGSRKGFQGTVTKRPRQTGDDPFVAEIKWDEPKPERVHIDRLSPLDES